jgi:hypothetical protein
VFYDPKFQKLHLSFDKPESLIPVIFKPGEKDFTTNGLGRLIDATRCEITEEANGK